MQEIQVQEINFSLGSTALYSHPPGGVPWSCGNDAGSDCNILLDLIGGGGSLAPPVRSCIRRSSPCTCPGSSPVKVLKYTPFFDVSQRRKGNTNGS